VPGTSVGEVNDAMVPVGAPRSFSKMPIAADVELESSGLIEVE